MNEQPFAAMADLRNPLGSSQPTFSSQHSFGRGSFGNAHLPNHAVQPERLGPSSSAQSQLFPNSSSIGRRSTETGIPTPHLRLSTSDPAQTDGIDPVDGALQAIMLRRLPRTMTHEHLRGMLLFAKELLEVGFVGSSPNDAGYTSALAFFRTATAAREAQDSLDGKVIAASDAPIIVELLPPSALSAFTDPAAVSASVNDRRSTLDGTALRTERSSTSSESASGGVRPRPVRYNSNFQPIDGVTSFHSVEHPVQAEHTSRYSSIFSPKSPHTNPVRDRQQNPGRTVINDDVVDDETDGILRDPLAYAIGGQHDVQSLRTDSQLPIDHFGHLSLDGGGRGSGYSDGVSPETNIASPLAATGRQHSVAAAYQQQQQQQQPVQKYQNVGYHAISPPRTSYPPANPADQNPPCNTLYVGNLPNNTSEDELKRMFSQQRGFKRLCFRTKANGPMCFVEFESITLATKALSELYGKMLSNSVKGGIRLSFSKNPLGVRNGQGNMPPFSPLSPHGGPPGFGTNVQPPPGLASGPPGLANRGQSFNQGQSSMPDSFSMSPSYQNNLPDLQSPTSPPFRMHQPLSHHNSPFQMNHADPYIYNTEPGYR